MKLNKMIFSTLLLGVAFGLLFLGYLALVSLLVSLFDIEWDIDMVHFVLPILLPFGVCFLLNQKTFRFNRKHLSDKLSIRRLLVRLIAVAVVLIAGYIICKLIKYGGNVILRALCNYFFYIIIAIFLLVFSVIECLFVPSCSNLPGGV